ncbi:MAG: MBL fold metallo-hydrolase [Calditrichales bacterium]|nr:MAG: MBL fold metallo-hydrolase [Calditrichales bacterium]
MNKKHSFWLIIILASFLQNLPGQQSDAPVRIIDEIKAHKTGMAVWWTGHNGWLIKYNDTLIGTDLALESDERAVIAPVTAAELAPELDISFITHEHGDHFERETSRMLARDGHCLFVMPSNCKEIAQTEAGIPEDRIQVARPRMPFTINDIKIEPIRAIHGNPKFAVFYDANLEDCGYLITLGGKRLLQMGDTVLLEDHQYLKSVDVLFFSPTEHNTHIDPSVILINELNPQYIFPQHRETFRVTPENRYWTSAYPYEVKMRLSKETQKNYHILKMGQKIEIN